MPSPFEKPRTGIDRRTFVRRAMGTAAAGAVGVTGLGFAFPLSTTGGINLPRFPYLGARKIDGPAPKGIPIIPVKVESNGDISGMPDLLDWYKYCSHNEAPGLEPDFTDDNKFYYFQNPEKIHFAHDAGIELWYEKYLPAQPSARAADLTALNVAHFKEAQQHQGGGNVGAPFRWRSENQVQNNIVTGIAILIDPANVKSDSLGGKSAVDMMDQGMIAFCSFCAHFCCVPGYKEAQDAKARGHWENIFCTCHGSAYDPFDVTTYQFPPDK